jgi:RNA polymerase sigma-70 factor (ECF subfamily)
VATVDDILWALALERAVAEPAPTSLLRDLLWRSLHLSGWRPQALDFDNPLTAGSDRSLLERFIHGDPEAFELLVDRHGGVLLAFARRSLPHEYADDAVQEAFLALFSKAHTVIAAADRNVRGFLFRTTRLEVKRNLGQLVREAGPPAAMVGALPADGPDVLERLRGREPLELAALLLEACDSLEQETVLMRLAGRSDAEIATALELEPGHVRVIEHRAGTRLAAALDRDPR